MAQVTLKVVAISTIMMLGLAMALATFITYGKAAVRVLSEVSGPLTCRIHVALVNASAKCVAAAAAAAAAGSRRAPEQPPAPCYQLFVDVLQASAAATNGGDESGDGGGSARSPALLHPYLSEYNASGECTARECTAPIANAAAAVVVAAATTSVPPRGGGGSNSSSSGGRGSSRRTDTGGGAAGSVAAVEATVAAAGQREASEDGAEADERESRDERKQTTGDGERRWPGWTASELFVRHFPQLLASSDGGSGEFACYLDVSSPGHAFARLEREGVRERRYYSRAEAIAILSPPAAVLLAVLVALVVLCARGDLSASPVMREHVNTAYIKIGDKYYMQVSSADGSPSGTMT